MKEPTAEKSGFEPRLDWGRIRIAMSICVLVLLLWGALLIGSGLFLGRDAVVCFQFMYFRGAVGIPAAIITSVSVVVLLAAGIGGEFKVQLWGLSLEGPSAPITMWVVCFLAISLALYMLIPAADTVTKLPPIIGKFCAANN